MIPGKNGRADRNEAESIEIGGRHQKESCSIEKEFE